MVPGTQETNEPMTQTSYGPATLPLPLPIRPARSAISPDFRPSIWPEDDPKAIQHLIIPKHERFEIHTAALDWINRKAIPMGFTVAIKECHLRRGYATVVCWRGQSSGRKKDENTQRTVKINCPFQIKLTRHHTMSAETAARCGLGLGWSATVTNNVHNHLQDEPLVMPIARRFNDGEGAALRTMLDNRTTPHRILQSMQGQGRPVVPHDIYNFSQQLKRAEIGGHTPSEACIKLLDDEKELYYAWIEPGTNKLLSLLLSSHSAAALTRRYPTVLAMDCTYRTNKFNMPAFHIVGKTGTGNAFTSAVIWMPNSEQQSYERSLEKYVELVLQGQPSVVRVVITDREKALGNAIRSIMPLSKHLLCQYHIFNNISTAARANAPIPNEVFEPVMKAYKETVVWAKTAIQSSQGLRDLIVQ